MKALLQEIQSMTNADNNLGTDVNEPSGNGALTNTPNTNLISLEAKMMKLITTLSMRQLRYWYNEIGKEYISLQNNRSLRSRLTLANTYAKSLENLLGTIGQRMYEFKEEVSSNLNSISTQLSYSE